MKSDLLRAERIQHGWSQAKLAEALGVDTRTVRRWERGQAVPFPYYRKQLVALFGKTPEELGLPSDSDEGNVVREASLSIAQPTTPDTPAATSFLIDPAFPQTLGRTTSLLGRDSLLMQLKEHLLAEENLAFTALYGLPGSGKTALATTVAIDQQVLAHFSDGVLWAGLGQHPNVLGQLTRWGKLLGVAPDQVENTQSREDWGRALRAAIGTRRFLLVIDDAWSNEDAQAFQIGGPQCSHLLTTSLPQIAFTFAQEEAILVPRLEEAEGLALLARFVPQLVEHYPRKVQALVHALDGLPLALTLMGYYLAFQSSIGWPQPLQAALIKLHDAEQRMGTLNRPAEPSSHSAAATPRSLYAVIAICDEQQLSQRAHAALQALASLPPKPSSFSEEEALVVSQQPVEALDELWDAGLLESCGLGRYTLHQAIVDYVHTLDEIPADQEQQVDSVSTNLQIHRQRTHASSITRFPQEDAYRGTYIKQQEIHSLMASLSLQLSAWRTSFQKQESANSRPSKRFLPPSLLILLVILLAIVVISATIIQGFILRPSHPSTPVPATYGPPSYTLTIPTIDPSLHNIAQHLQQAFFAVYPQLVNRFAADPAAAPRNVTLIFSPALSSSGAVSDTTITLNPNWMQQHPSDVGLLTYQLTLLLEQHPSGVPAWFNDGMANYARSVYGPADDDWSLPDSVQPQDSYTQGGGVAARFLLWLEQYTRFDIVDQLNHALQAKKPFLSIFRRLTHHAVDDLWSQYKAYPAITLLPEQLYKTVTSRKPLYQSSFRVQDSTAETYWPMTIPGLNMSNFAVQADMTIVQGDGGGFVFRFNSQGFTGDRLRVSPDGAYDLVNQTNSFASGFSFAIKQGLKETNRLAIIVQKHTIYLYINGQFVTQVDDSNTSYGEVGVLAFNSGHATDVRFEHLQVF